MNFNYFRITLTNGTVEMTYDIKAFNKEQAIILAQAEAINRCYGYTLVSAIKI